MKVMVTKSQIEKVINELVEYNKELDKEFPDDQNFKEIKTFKEFLIDDKTKELVEKLLNEKKDSEIEVLVVDKENPAIFQESRLLLEWEQYKKIPKTNLTYRYDQGQDRKGMDDHIHVYLGKTKNQVYAINRKGSTHDGSKAKLNKKEIKFLKSIGFTPPKDGILEWIVLSLDKEYVGYKKQLLFD